MICALNRNHLDLLLLWQEVYSGLPPSGGSSRTRDGVSACFTVSDQT